MSSEIAVVLGLSVVSGLFAWYSFELKNDPSEVTKKLGVLLWFFSLFFSNLVVYSILLIAQHSNLEYLKQGVLGSALIIMTWVSVILVFVFVFGTVLATIDSMKEWVRVQRRGRNTP
jgi:uncharacterized membrane protein (DUF485 family)